MITAYSRGRKNWWIPWSLSMKGCRDTEGGSAGGHSTSSAASRFWEKHGNAWCEMAKKGCPDLQGALPQRQEWVGSEGFGVQWTMRGSGAVTGSHSPGESGWAELLGQNRANPCPCLSALQKGAADTMLRGYPSRIPVRRPWKALDTREHCEDWNAPTALGMPGALTRIGQQSEQCKRGIQTPGVGREAGGSSDISPRLNLASHTWKARGEEFLSGEKITNDLS